jgi:hypothetical protein
MGYKVWLGSLWRTDGRRLVSGGADKTAGHFTWGGHLLNGARRTAAWRNWRWDIANGTNSNDPFFPASFDGT